MSYESWGITTWPEKVWPHTPSRARNMIAKYKASLLEANAISRIGRELVIDGQRYRKWIDSHQNKVNDFDTKGAEAMRERWKKIAAA